MTSWIKTSSTTFIIKRGGKTFQIENLEKLFVYSLAMGIKFNDIEFALLEMEKNDHDYCEFGIWNGFTISKKLDEKLVTYVC